MINERMIELAGLELSEAIKVKDSSDKLSAAGIAWDIKPFGEYHTDKNIGRIHRAKIIDITDEGIEFRDGRQKSLRRWEYIEVKKIVFLMKGEKLAQIATEFAHGNPIVYAVGRK